MEGGSGPSLPPSSGGYPLARVMEEINEAAPGEFVPIVQKALAQHGASGVRLFFVDVEERELRVWDEAGDQPPLEGRRLLVEGSLHGAVYRSGRPTVGSADGHRLLIVPVLVRAERMGVLEVRYEEDPGPEARDATAAIGLLLGNAAIVADRWTDRFQVARRRQEMDLAAEMQWSALPLAAFATGRVSLAGALEPAYEIAGDLFDYACSDADLSAVIFDGMGHGMRSARLSDLAVTAYRNSRRCGHDLAKQVQVLHELLRDVFDLEGYVTGQILWIDLEEPVRSQIVNAGHPLPYLQRGDDPPVQLDLHVNLPFGMPFRNEFEVQPLPLYSGDRLVLFSDGVVEARPETDLPFGHRRLEQVLVTARDLPPREAGRRVIGAVREYRAGDLVDDATLLIIDLP